jgi:two-component system, LytTR family, response regulator LytT
MITVLIVDDESPAREELRFILEKITDISVVGEAANGITALKIITEIKPDLVFIDIQMPGLDGIELSRLINSMKEPPVLVFATAYEHYAVKAFEIETFDYILKPFVDKRILKTVAKVKEYIKMKKTHENESGETKERDARIKKVLLYDNEKIIPVSPNHILFAVRDKSSVIVKTSSGVFLSKLSLNELEFRLSRYGFIRTHRRSLVNTNYILEVIPWFNSSSHLIMNDKERTEIEVSRYNTKNLKNYFK